MNKGHNVLFSFQYRTICYSTSRNDYESVSMKILIDTVRYDIPFLKKALLDILKE